MCTKHTHPKEDDDDGRRRHGYDANENMTSSSAAAAAAAAHAGNNETSKKVFVPATIASDVELRRKVIAVFNKRRQDFPSDSAHNDYLEFVEDVCFKLIEGIDVAETEKIVAKEKRERAKEIQSAKRKERGRGQSDLPGEIWIHFWRGARVYRRSHQSKGGGGRRCVADDDDGLSAREHESEER